MASNRLKNQHLLWRAAFGPMAENVAQLEGISQKKLWDLLVKTSRKAPEKLQVSSGLVDGLVKGIGDAVTMAQISAEDKKKMRKEKRKQYRDELNNLNLMWLDEMINSEAQLREKMSLFWHGHFATRVINSYFQQELLQVIRTHALGSFREMLHEVSKSPTMLQFLNNQQNRKSHPNENFAREVMELFTMGRGNYTETDVKEAARAFTGWGFNGQGEFIFRKQAHDTGVKTILGKTGNFDGDDVLDIILEHPQTAYFVTQKIYRYFVNEQAPGERIQGLATRFQKNNYDILKLLEDIYTSSWFYDDENIGAKIKSPVELLVGIRRYLPMELDNDAAQLLFEKMLGQILFYPPNVAGWPGGRSWIDSSSLMLRLQVPQVYTAKEAVSLRPKNDDDVNMGMSTEKIVRIERNKAYINKGGAADIKWDLINSAFEKTPRPALTDAIMDTLLQTKSRINKNTFEDYLDDSNRENYIKSAVINLMSTPEYQMC